MAKAGLDAATNPKREKTPKPLPGKSQRPYATMPPMLSQHTKSHFAHPKVASDNTSKTHSSLNQKSNPKHKKPPRKVATFTKTKVATKKTGKKSEAKQT